MVSHSIYQYIYLFMQILNLKDVGIERRFIYGEYFSDRSRKPFNQC
ncbi:Uncharacterized protein BM_BM16950 [Brugia malayi]|uniref:Bm16950 n=1 Tax=Brugia malayi TaxID=6279 RepID=A0A0I9N872_BRUMA|nr:Uncharacterized protein BM_BM16950 [Brugia malayi]CTP82169.1 Bm16950 [Brugia malayi]VIO96300.1 Uncharacterized protein BM_BM16950 [Brugia malayi]